MSTHRHISTSLVTLLLLTGCFALTATPSFAGQREYPEEITESFGNAGTGNEQFKDPTGIAVNETTGNVYVVDKGNNRVQEFGPEGKYISQFNGSGTPAKSFSEPSSIAIDNSTDAAKGRVYVVDNGHNVVDVFNSAGTYLYQLTGTPIGGFAFNGPYGKNLKEAGGVSVDGAGNVWISQYVKFEEKKGVEEFSDTGSFLLHAKESGEIFYGIAVDSGEAIYGFRNEEKGSGGSAYVEKRNAAGVPVVLAEYELPVVEGEIGGLAVDLASHYVFFDVPGAIEEYAPFEGKSPFPHRGFGTPFQVFATKGLGESRGIAVDAATNVVYATEAKADKVAIIPPVAIVTAPTVNDLPPVVSDLKRTSALVSATLNPDNGQGHYHLEYVEAQSYEPEATDPYAAGGSTPETTFGRKLKGAEEDDTDQEIGPVVLSGLKAGTTYDYRLVASNQVGTAIGPDYTFTTAPPTPPVVNTGPSSEVTQTSVTLTGRVDAEGLQTSYEFDIGTGTAGEGAKLFGNAGQSTRTETIAVSLAFLIPGTTYHYRIIATNTDGTSYGQEQTFTTTGVSQTIVQPLSEPLLATPAIAFPTVSSKPSKPKAKTLTKAQKLAMALRACHKKAKGKRAACKAKARKRYAPVKKTRKK